MNHSIFNTIALLLLGLGGLLAACSTNTNQGQTTATPVEISATLPDSPAQPISGEIVSGDLGKVLDDYISQDKPLFSGSILVARDGEVLLSKGYNYANWELKSPNSAQTKYRISSITKPITATMIMMLAEGGLLNLDDKLCDHLSGCPNEWQEITIQDLLAHTSGVPEYTTLLGAAAESREPHNVRALIDLFQDESLEFPAGETYQYSNSNYILLGAVVEQVSGQRYGEFLEKAILNPLDIEESGMDYADRILKDRAAGYRIEGRALINAPYLDMSNAYATAGMYSTVGDLYAFDQALYNELLISQESQEIMYTPQFAADGSGGSYGLGWQLGEAYGHRRVGHSGGINGFRVFMGRYLDDRVTIIVLSNIETEDVGNIVEDLEQIIFNKG